MRSEQRVPSKAAAADVADDGVHVSRRRFALEMQQPPSRATLFDRAAFLAGAACAVWLAVLIALQGFASPWSFLLFVPVWAITAYLVLPRLHRLLSDLYVPDYFFGRTRTADGLLGDPVNLGVDGSADQLDAVMRRAGWHRADEITAVSTWRIIVSTLTRRSYPTAPVSPLMLFGRRHDLAYQQEVEGNPKQRHHVRFWHCPPGWLLPGGAHADWMGAGTYDTDVGLSFFTLQVTHRIDENTDEERDYVVESAVTADSAVVVRTLRDFTTGYHSRNGGGDRFITDGHLPIIDVNGVDAGEGRVEPGSDIDSEAPRMGEVARRAPLSVLAVAALVALGAVLDFASLFSDESLRRLLEDGTDLSRAAYAFVIVLVLALTLAQLTMVWFVLRGGHRSRAVLMMLMFLDIVSTALDYLNGSAVLGLDSTLLSASLMCLGLLALSSESAGAWARGSRARRRARGSRGKDRAQESGAI